MTFASLVGYHRILSKKIFQHTTQFTRLTNGTTLKRVFESPSIDLNVTRRSEPAGCDIVYVDVLAIDDASDIIVFLLVLMTR